MSKSKVIPLPAESVITLWHEGTQMCVGLSAPGLPKGLRLSTKASGDAGKELAAYHQKLQRDPIIAELKDAGIRNVDCDDDGGVLHWVTKGLAATLNFTFNPSRGGYAVDIDSTHTTSIDHYRIAFLLRRLIDTYGEKIVGIEHNDNVIGALVALSYLPGVSLNAIDQVVRKENKTFTLTQAGDQLGFFIRNNINDGSIDLATACAKALDREDSVIILTDDSVDDLIVNPRSALDPEQLVREYMTLGNCVWVADLPESVILFAPGDVTYTLTPAMGLQSVSLEGKDVSTNGAEHELIFYVNDVLISIRGEDKTAELRISSKLQTWTQRLREQGVDRPEEAARMLLANSMI